MAQHGPQDHRADSASTDDHSFVPPMTMSFLDPTENDNGGSRIGSPETMDAGKGKDVVVPDAIQGGEQGSDSGSKANTSRSEGNKNSGEAAIAAADAAGDGLTTDGNNSLAAAAEDDGDLKVQLIVERERRRRMKELFSTLRDLMPHVPKKVDKVTLVEDAIDFIRSLENTKAQLEKQRQQQVLARQAAAEARASSMSVPRTAHGMAALSDGWDPMPQQQQQPAASAAAGPVEFRTWSTPNVVLSVLTNGEAVINVCAPRQPRIVMMVVSVLKKHGIDVVSMQVAADRARSIFTIYTRVNGAGRENPSADDIYKLAVSEIMVWLSS